MLTLDSATATVKASAWDAAPNGSRTTQFVDVVASKDERFRCGDLKPFQRKRK